MDESAETRKGWWRWLSERLGFAACYGGGGGRRTVVPPPVAAVEERRYGEAERSVELGCLLGLTLEGEREEEEEEEEMNLAAALAAERHFRAAEAEAEAEESEALVGTPLRVSLMRLLEDKEEDVSGVGGEGGEGSWCCCVCMGRRKGSAFIPCGHTFCRVCARELCLNRGSCPLCNRSIVEILDIF